MNAQELWNKYKEINPSIGDDIDAWQFGLEADLLAKLVLEGDYRIQHIEDVVALLTDL